LYYWQSIVYGGQPGKTGGIYAQEFGTNKPPTAFLESMSGQCVGCHSLSRDGERITVGLDDPDADDEFFDVWTRTYEVKMKTVVSGGGVDVNAGFQTFASDHTRMIASTFAYQGGGSTAFDIWDGDGKTKLATAQLPANVLGTHPDLSRDNK